MVGLRGISSVLGEYARFVVGNSKDARITADAAESVALAQAHVKEALEHRARVAEQTANAIGVGVQVASAALSMYNAVGKAASPEVKQQPAPTAPQHTPKDQQRSKFQEIRVPDLVYKGIDVVVRVAREEDTAKAGERHGEVASRLRETADLASEHRTDARQALRDVLEALRRRGRALSGT